MVSLIAAALLVPSAGFTIAKDGVAQCSIGLLSTEPSARYGAQELQSTLKQITGADFKIVNQPQSSSAMILIFSDPKLKEEEYALKLVGGNLVISGGGKRGPLYGCYTFLQDVLGCRWFTSKIARIPKNPNLAVSSLNIHDKPAFEYRDPYWTEAFDGTWAARNKVNGAFITVGDERGGKVTYGKFVHTFWEIINPKDYFKDHPEYFSFVNGKRQDGYTQLCLTNPDVLKITVDKVKEWVKENPKATIFSVSQNDTYSNCQCENCLKIEKEEESPAGPLLRFVNKVADEVGKAYPNVLIDTLAYQWSEKPPKTEKPHKNVRVRIAPIGACFSHPLNVCDKNKTPLANLQAWSKITNQLYVWHYCTDFAGYLQPLPCIDEIIGDVKLFRDSGVVGLFDEGAYPPGGGADMAELKSYLLARLMWNPDLDPKPIIAEFLEGVYGAAAPLMQQWLDLTHRAARTQNVHATIYDPPTAPYFPQDLLDQGRKLFSAAEYRTTSDPVAHEMVQRAKMGLLYLEVMRMDRKDPLWPDRAKELAASIKRFGVTQTSEGGASSEFLKRIGQG